MVNIKDQYGTGEVVLLAQDEDGYVNLSYLISDALMAAEGGEDAAIDITDLQARHQGLILLTGGAIDGFIGASCADNQMKRASDRLAFLSEFMKERIYIELQRHGHNEERIAEPALLKLADETGLPLVATNDNHFEDGPMQAAQNVLTCIASGTRISQLDRPIHNAEYRYKTAQEMAEIFADIPEAIHNSLVIAKRCAFMVPSLSLIHI